MSKFDKLRKGEEGRRENKVYGGGRTAQEKREMRKQMTKNAGGIETLEDKTPAPSDGNMMGRLLMFLKHWGEKELSDDEFGALKQRHKDALDALRRCPKTYMQESELWRKLTEEERDAEVALRNARKIRGWLREMPNVEKHGPIPDS